METGYNQLIFTGVLFRMYMAFCQNDYTFIPVIPSRRTVTLLHEELSNLCNNCAIR